MPKATHTHTTGCVVAPSRRHLIGGSILTAYTPEGLHAKAGFLLAHLENDGEESEITRSLACDVLGRASA